MTVDFARQLVVRCDRCGVPALGPTGLPQGWFSKEAALADLAGGEWQWRITVDEQVCASCVQAQRCLADGHRWSAWRSLAPLGGDPRSGIRFCTGCGTDQVIDTIPRQAKE